MGGQPDTPVPVTTSEDEGMAKGPMVEVQNVVSPGHVYRVDAAKYGAMREAMLAVLPSEAPGLSVAGIRAEVLPRLPDALFPGGAKAGWWIKCVQLDLEAKGVIRRTDKPVRLYKA
jgi:hypothetical protein